MDKDIDHAWEAVGAAIALRGITVAMPDPGGKIARRVAALKIGMLALDAAAPMPRVTFTSERLPPDCKSRRTFAEWCRSRVTGAELHGKIWSCGADAWFTARKCQKQRSPSIAKPVYDLNAILRANGQRKAG